MEQLTLPAQFKDSFIRVQDFVMGGRGEDDYDQMVHDLLSELPFFEEVLTRCKRGLCLYIYRCRALYQYTNVIKCQRIIICLDMVPLN